MTLAKVATGVASLRLAHEASYCAVAPPASCKLQVELLCHGNILLNYACNLIQNMLRLALSKDLLCFARSLWSCCDSCCQTEARAPQLSVPCTAGTPLTLHSVLCKGCPAQSGNGWHSVSLLVTRGPTFIAYAGMLWCAERQQCVGCFAASEGAEACQWRACVE